MTASVAWRASRLFLYDSGGALGSKYVTPTKPGIDTTMHKRQNFKLKRQKNNR